VTFELGRSLLLADAVAPDALAHALLVVANNGVCLPRALVAVGAIDIARLEDHLARGDAPVMRHVVPVPELMAKLPHGLCERLLAIPVRQDPRTGTVDLAIVDARDPHAGDEVSFWLEAPVRLVRTSFAAMDAALKRSRIAPEKGLKSLAAPIWVPAGGEVRTVAETPLYGTRAVEDPAMTENDEALHRTDVENFPSADPNIPIPLSRRSMRVSIVEVDGASVAIGVENVEPPLVDPVLDLRQRKRASAPPPAEPAPVSRTPITSRGPFAPNAPTLPFADIGSILASIRGASDRDRALDLFLTGARTVARRVALFAVKKTEMVGWTCTPEFGDRMAVRKVQIPLDAPTLLTRALPGGTHLGRLARIEAHLGLFEMMGGAPPREVAVTGVRVEGRPTIVALADEVGDTLIATRRLDELARVTGEALAAIIRQRRRASA
jgi:hypothetical protein